MTTTANRAKDATFSIQDSGGTPRLLTVNITDFGALVLTKAQLESGGYGEDMRYTHGRGDSPMTITGNFTTTVDVGTHTVLEPLARLESITEVIVSLGENAPPTTGNAKFTGSYGVFDYQVVNGLNDLRTFTASLMLKGPLPVWGTVA